MKRFWMVYVEGKNAPTRLHPTEADALTEAARLVSMQRCIAYILEATHVVTQAEPPIISEKLSDD